MTSNSTILWIFTGLLCVLQMAVGAEEIKFSVMLKEGDKEMDWDESLSDQHTLQFQKLAKTVRAKIGILFLNKTSLQDIKINAFWQGSVYANSTIVFEQKNKKSLNSLITVINKTHWIDLNTGTPPRSYHVSCVFVNHSSKAKVDLPSTLENMFKGIPGFQDVIILEYPAGDGDHLEMRLLFDSRSRVNADELRTIIIHYKAENGAVQFTNVTIKEEKLTFPPKTSKPTWLVIIVALSCISIMAGLIAFVYRVFKQSFLKAPKFKFNNDEKEDDQNRHRSLSRASTETLSSLPQPHQNCVTSPVGAL